MESSMFIRKLFIKSPGLPAWVIDNQWKPKLFLDIALTGEQRTWNKTLDLVAIVPSCQSTCSWYLIRGTQVGFCNAQQLLIRAQIRGRGRIFKAEFVLCFYVVRYLPAENILFVFQYPKRSASRSASQSSLMSPSKIFGVWDPEMFFGRLICRKLMTKNGKGFGIRREL
jgi:hypothetical protein